MSFRHLVFCWIGFFLSACSDFTEQQNGMPAFQNKPEVNVVRYGLVLAEKNSADFLKQTEFFSGNLKSYCKTLDAAVDQNRKNSNVFAPPQESFARLLQSFYHLQSFAVGALQTKDELSPLSEVYYRTLNRCVVDTNVLVTKNNQPLQSPLHPSISGLAAIEYLLFNKSLDSQCNVKAHPQVAAWNLLPPLEKMKDRCRLAIELQKKIDERAQKWSASWKTTSSDYEAHLQKLEFTKSEASAFKNMIQALAALEKVKDFDLGKPLGQNSLCTSDSGKCPEDVQHAPSNLSFLALIYSLEGFQRFFKGLSPLDPSLKSFLMAKQQTSLAEKLDASIQAAMSTAQQLQSESTLIEKVKQMNPVLCSQTTWKDPKEPVCFLFKQVEQITDIYKAELLTFLSLEINQSLPQGDND